MWSRPWDPTLNHLASSAENCQEWPLGSHITTWKAVQKGKKILASVKLIFKWNLNISHVNSLNLALTSTSISSLYFSIWRQMGRRDCFHIQNFMRLCPWDLLPSLFIPCQLSPSPQILYKCSLFNALQDSLSVTDLVFCLNREQLKPSAGKGTSEKFVTSLTLSLIKITTSVSIFPTGENEDHYPPSKMSSFS